MNLGTACARFAGISESTHCLSYVLRCKLQVGIATASKTQSKTLDLNTCRALHLCNLTLFPADKAIRIEQQIASVRPRLM